MKIHQQLWHLSLASNTCLILNVGSRCLILSVGSRNHDIIRLGRQETKKQRQITVLSAATFH